MKLSGAWWIGLAVLALLLLGGGAVVVAGSRGYRNNNPGNIRPDKRWTWQGQVGVDSGGYLVFDSMANGIRAMAVDLKNKITKRGLNTIEKIIPVYAPAADNNNVAAYIASVEKHSGIARNKILTPLDLLPIVRAMARHELGAASYALVSQADFVKGVNQA